MAGRIVGVRGVDRERIVGSIGNIRGNCRRNFAITALLRFSRRVLIVPIIAAAIINSSIARTLRSAAVASAAAIATGAACYAAIRSGR